MAETTLQKLEWGLNGFWIFESSDDGAIFYYPHGWGRAYVVPTEEKRREIEEFLALWLMRLRSLYQVSVWSLPLLLITFALGHPPFCNIIWYLPVLPQTLFRSVLLVGALSCLLVGASPLALRFLAEAAKADLEKAKKRRRFVESLKDYAGRSDWRRLWIEVTCSGLVPLAGVRLLWPRRETVMLPARVNPHFLTLGVVLIFLGIPMILIKLYEIRAKLERERGSI